MYFATWHYLIPSPLEPSYIGIYVGLEILYQTEFIFYQVKTSDRMIDCGSFHLSHWKIYYHSIEIQKLLQLVVFQKTVPYLCIRTPHVRDLNANHTAKYFILILDHEQYVDFPR